MEMNAANAAQHNVFGDQKLHHFLTSFLKLKEMLAKPNVENLMKTIIPFALVGYEIGNSQLGTTRFVGYLPSRIQRGLME